MAPLVVMLIGWIAAGILGLSGLVYQADSWSGSLRFALAAMFAFTAASHFHPRMRPELVRMVPPKVPARALLVTATGGLELVGAAALLWPASAPAAAYGLIGLLVVMFPANVHAARAGLIIAERAATPLVFRLPLQVFWVSTLWWVARSTSPH